uniref:Uncharacterized protein n=1 Tax=Anguilla anguilla TaxID=7936 RepID=A0A0E9SKM2_ANGAN
MHTQETHTRAHMHVCTKHWDGNTGIYAPISGRYSVSRAHQLQVTPSASLPS